ncbi:glycosyltransferase [Aerococcus urinaeequi]|uniref:glycosyltransferase n=1 Tax=Aerococcus urinaeequi TaxID=51665 RepID=UPI003AAA30BB
MKKVLMVTSVASMIRQFNLPNIKILRDLNYQVTVATNFVSPGTMPIEESNKLMERLSDLGVIIENISFNRSPVHGDNFKAYKQLEKLIIDNEYDLIHCQSPIGGVITRLAVNRKKSKSKIIYTAHGFHFFNGGPKRNWVVYPIEKLSSIKTDIIITINKEDYNRAKNFNTCDVEYVPGVGVDTYKISETLIDRSRKRETLGISPDSFLILSVGEVNDRKNHSVIVKAISEIKNRDIQYVICGLGEKTNEIKVLAEELGISSQVHFLGYRNDLNEIYHIADLFAFPSKREGLGLAGIEAMAAGLPIVTSNINGINDYSENGITGYKYDYDDYKGFSVGIKKIINMEDKKRKTMGQNNIKKSRRFDQINVNKKMREIYSKIGE